MKALGAYRPLHDRTGRLEKVCTIKKFSYVLHDRTGRLETSTEVIFGSEKLHDRTGRLESLDSEIYSPNLLHDRTGRLENFLLYQPSHIATSRPHRSLRNELSDY